MAAASGKGVGHHNILHTLQEQTQAARDLLKKIMEFGPQTPQFTAHLQDGVASFKAAYEMIVQHFGLAASPVDVQWDEIEQDAEVKQLVEDLEQRKGVSGPDGRQGIREILTFLIQNPQLITLLLSWFKR